MRLGGAYVEIRGDSRKLKPDLDDARRMTEKAAVGMRDSFDRVKRSVFSLGAAITGIAGVYSLGKIASGMLDTAKAFEKYEVMLTTITGSSTKAKASMDWVAEFTAKTPYELDQVTGAFAKLSAYGLDAQKWMKPLGDTASAMGKDLNQSVEMFADAVTGEFERLKEFGVKASTQGDQVTFKWSQNGKDMVLTAQKTQSGISDALGQIFKRFEGGMDAQSKTFEGIMSNISDNFTMLEKKVMDAGLFDELKSQASAFNDELVRWTENNKDIIAQRIPEYINAYKDALKGVYDVMSAFADLSGLAGAWKAGAIGVTDIAGMNWKEIEDYLKKLDQAGTGRASTEAILEKIRADKQKQLDQANYLKSVSQGNSLFTEEDTARIRELEKTIGNIDAKLLAIRQSGGLGKSFQIDWVEVKTELFEYFDGLEKTGKASETTAKAIDKLTESMDKLTAAEKKGMLNLAPDVSQNDLMNRVLEGGWGSIGGNTYMRDSTNYANIQSEWESINADIVNGQADAAKETQELWQHTMDTIQDSMAGVFSDALKGELDNGMAYFKSFAGGMSDIWASTMSQVLMSGKGLFGMSFGKTMIAGLGAGVLIGGANFMANAWMNDSAEDSARRKARAEAYANLSASLQDTIDKNTLNDLDYQITKLNEKYRVQAAQAADLGVNLDLVTKARKAELEALMDQAASGFTSLLDSIEAWNTDRMRRDWGVSEYTTEYNRLDDVLAGMSRSDSDYQDQALKILGDQFDILKSIDSLNQEQLQEAKSLLATYDNQIKSVEGMMAELTVGDLAPARSMEAMANTYGELLAGAMGGGQDQLSDYLSFIKEYADFAGAYGMDYGTVTAGIVDDLSAVRDALENAKSADVVAMEALEAAVSGNTLATAGNTTELAINSKILTAINTLSETIQGEADTARLDAWLKSFTPASGQFSTGFYPQSGGYGGMGNWARNYEIMQALQGASANMEGILAAAPDTANANVMALWQAWLDAIPALPANINMNDAPAVVALWQAWLSKMPTAKFAAGGLTSGLSWAGEMGREWIVPTYEPQRSSFLRDVGADPEKIGAAVARAIAPTIMAIAGTGGGQTKIVLNLNGREIGNAVAEEISGGNYNLNSAMQRAVRRMGI